MSRRSYPKPPRQRGQATAFTPDAPPCPYNFKTVPNCIVSDRLGIQGSVLQSVRERAEWAKYISELVFVSHEAGRRRAEKTGVFRGIHHDHAELERLSYAFILERTETDDPIKGYVIRADDDSRRLQGFCWYTTFTIWTKYFKWDSFSDIAGLLEKANADGISWDSDGELARELEMQERGGDPNKEGVIWSRVAEVALVGALECGRFLVQLILEEIEASNDFDYVVVQATESSAGFYDKMGFKRVGAVAKYFEGEGVEESEDVQPVAYRHWAYPDEDVKVIDSSIMMALRLRKGEIHKTILSEEGGILAHVDRFSRGADGQVAERGYNELSLKCAPLPVKARPHQPWTQGSDSPSSRREKTRRQDSKKASCKPNLPSGGSAQKKRKVQNSDGKSAIIELPVPVILSKRGRSITPSKRFSWSSLKWQLGEQVPPPLSPSADSVMSQFSTVDSQDSFTDSDSVPAVDTLMRHRPTQHIRPAVAARPRGRPRLITSNIRARAMQFVRESRKEVTKRGLGVLGRAPKGSKQKSIHNRLIEKSRAMQAKRINQTNARRERVRQLQSRRKAVIQGLTVRVQAALPTVPEGVENVEDGENQDMCATHIAESEEASLNTSQESMQPVRKTRKCKFTGRRIAIRPPIVSPSSNSAAQLDTPQRRGPAQRKSPGRPVSARALCMNVDTGNAGRKGNVESEWGAIACGGCARKDKERQMILCDSCDAGWHLFCMNPPLQSVPEGRWICDACNDLKKKRLFKAQKNSGTLTTTSSKRPKLPQPSIQRSLVSRRKITPVERFRARFKVR